MDSKQQGIVLQTIRYGDTSLIVKMYTLSNGLQSFVAKGVGGKKSNLRNAFFQPLTLLQFEQGGRASNGHLAYLKEPELLYPYKSIPLHMEKNAILFYLDELLTRTLTQQEQNEDLYHFVYQSLLWLDLVETGYANFPIFFTLELSRFLGFYPQCNYENGFSFDMMEGQFVHDMPIHSYAFDAERSAQLACFLNLGINSIANVSLTGDQRSVLLDGIITFMRLHAPVLKGMQSHEIVRDIIR